MYEIEFSKTAEKQFYKLERDAQARILSSLERLKVRPQRYIERLVGSKYYKLRVDDYRVILDIQEHKLIIFVIEVGHRRNVYK